MRFSKSISVLMISGIVLGASAPAVFAEEEVKSTAETPMSIKLEESNSETDPVEPEDPGKDKDKEDPDNKPEDNKGPLSLDVAPRQFKFADAESSQTKTSYTGVAHEDGNLQYLQVTDNRDADVFGWNVTVRQEKYLENEDGYSLTGSYLSLPKRVSRNNLNEPTDKIDTDFYGDPLGDIQLEDSIVFKPTKQNGKGTSVNAWDPTDVKLTVPSSISKAGNYSTNIVWTLSATPEA